MDYVYMQLAINQARKPAMIPGKILESVPSSLKTTITSWQPATTIAMVRPMPNVTQYPSFLPKTSSIPLFMLPWNLAVIPVSSYHALN